MILHPISPAGENEPGAAAARLPPGWNAGEHALLVWDVVVQTRALYERAPRAAPWLGYLASDAETKVVVGTCGFKSGPRDGVVEIAYFTFPSLEGQGYATAMAEALIAIVERAGLARVAAETAPEKNASTRILEKLGFRRKGETLDDEIGRAWVWERPVGTADGNGS